MHRLQFDSLSVWIETLATLWRDRLRHKPTLRLCLPAGHTPLPLYDAIVESVRRGEVSFARAEVFALDEYGGLAPEDPGRCANMLRRHLVDHIDLPPAQFHYLDPDRPDLNRVCSDYEQAIGPGFDLALLGLGRNGHLGLNEPGSSITSVTRCVSMEPLSTAAAAAYVQDKALPTWGLTVGLGTLYRSREVWLLATGASKAAIVHRLWHGPSDPDVPASLMQQHPNCWLCVDEAAGSTREATAAERSCQTVDPAPPNEGHSANRAPTGRNQQCHGSG